RRQPDNDALVVVRTGHDRRRDRARASRDEAGRNRRRRNPAVYPVALDDASNGLQTVPFLSQPFLDRLTFAAAPARSLGLRVDLTLGSGWPSGGAPGGIRGGCG